MPNPKIIFIILIITLNLYDLSLSEFDCNTRPITATPDLIALDVSLTAKSCHKSVIIK
jgi:hypothetical protein